jgi:O-antigen ligase
LAITPFTSFDVINVIKLFTLSIAGFWSLSFLITEFSKFKRLSQIHKRYLMLGFLLAMLLFIPLARSVTYEQSIFGIYGRNTGLLANFSLLMILMAASLINSSYNLQRIYSTLLFTGALVGVYCLIQLLGLDPIDWATMYKPIYGTLGNPNFSSAFLGISVSASVVLLFSRRSLLNKTLIVIILGLGFFLTLATDSWQGTIMILSSLFIAALFGLHQKFRNRVLTFSFLLIGISLGVIGFLGMMGRGVLGGFLEKSTLAIRIEYWRTAISALQDNLLFGVGIDGFSDVFRYYRDEKTINLIGETVWTNSAHNVYLDFALSFGIFALFLLLALKLIVLVVSLKYLKSNFFKFDAYMGIFLAWVSYEIQAMISINQLGIGVWGWLLTGLLFGGAMIKSDAQQGNARERSQSRAESGTNEFKPLLWFSGAVLGLFLALPALLADSRFNASLKTENLEEIFSATKAFPVDSYRVVFVIDLLNKANLDSQAAELAEFGVSQFPTNYSLHFLRAKLPATSPQSKVISEQMIAQLNPLVDGRP